MQKSHFSLLLHRLQSGICCTIIVKLNTHQNAWSGGEERLHTFFNSLAIGANMLWHRLLFLNYYGRPSHSIARKVLVKFRLSLKIYQRKGIANPGRKVAVIFYLFKKIYPWRKGFLNSGQVIPFQIYSDWWIMLLKGLYLRIWMVLH